MSDLNKSILVGRLARDPELRYTPAGTPVASFAIANSKTFTQNNEKKEQVSFIDCVAWSKLGEVVTEYCRKGHRIAVEGRLTQRRWKDSDGNTRTKLEVIAENVQFLSQAKQEQQEEPAQHSKAVQNDEHVPSWDECSEDNPFSDDDMPF